MNINAQFTSAITGDLAGCLATNVIPTFNEKGGQDRKDAYILVSNKTKSLIESDVKVANDDEEKGILSFFKSFLEKDGRKICKTPVMVSNYGGTAGGRKDILWATMRSLNVNKKWITQKIAYHLSSLIGKSIDGVLSGGKAFEKYIHAMNNIIAGQGKVVRWTTSDGFIVNHVKKLELPKKDIRVTLPNARRITRISIKRYSEKVSASKMRSAISPNYIHSLDAELLRRTALRMKEYGIKNTDWIHDSFGCHPNHVDLLLKVTKEEFIKLIKQNPLQKLDEELLSQIEETKKSTKLLKKVVFPKLGELPNIEQVKLSDWFFS